MNNAAVLWRDEENTIWTPTTVDRLVLHKDYIGAGRKEISREQVEFLEFSKYPDKKLYDLIELLGLAWDFDDTGVLFIDGLGTCFTTTQVRFTPSHLVVDEGVIPRSSIDQIWFDSLPCEYFLNELGDIEWATV